jgi:hypothetical protein
MSFVASILEQWQTLFVNAKENCKSDLELSYLDTGIREIRSCLRADALTLESCWCILLCALEGGVIANDRVKTVE